MSYKVVKGKNGFDIYEKESEASIILEKTEEEARNLCRKLNLGAGFNGWTPAFVAEKMKGQEEA